MADNSNERLSRRERHSVQNKRSVPPGGYISRETAKRTINQQFKRPVRDEERVSYEQGRRNPNQPNVTNNSNYKRVGGGNSGNGGNNGRGRISVPRPPKKGPNIWLRILKYGLYAASIFIITIFLLCVFWIYQAPAFDSKVLDNNSRTIVYDVNNNEVAQLGNEVGENLNTKDIPTKMQDAILATEDNRFFEHGAVDYKRLVGAIVSNLTSGFGSQGASTISQQLIKRTFLDDNKNVKRKVQEAYLAYKLEQNYDKETIFTMYVNRIYYSDGVYGLKTAANYYYNKDLSELTLPQMALLAGMPQHPNTYNPYDNPDAAKSRRDTVLYLMQYHGKITAEEAEAAKKVDIMTGIVPRDTSNRVLLSSQFDSRYTGYMNEIVNELKNSKEFKDYEGDVLNLGLKVYTNFDPKIQTTISDSVNSNYAGLKQASNVAMVVLNNENSGIAAIYGGKNQAFNGYNVATQSKLQPGSSIKPILAYGPAIEYLDWNSSHIINDSKISGSQIQNWDRVYHGNITMNNAIMMSYNIPAIKTYQEVGFDKVKRYAKNVGMDITDDSITTPIGGSQDGFSPLQMAGAYVPFSNGGYYATPKAINKVVDNEGLEIKSFNTDDRKRVIKESTAYIMTSMLRNVVNGTAQSAAIGGLDMGVKTGTTTFGEAEANKFGFDIDNSAKDSWVVGYTSGYTLAIWQGFDSIDGPTKYLTKDDTTKTQVLYRINMQNINRIHPAKGFSVPNNVGTVNGAVKVITDDEKKEIEEQAKKAKEEAENRRNNSESNSNDNQNNTNNNDNNNNNTNNTNSTNSNNTTNGTTNNRNNSNNTNTNNRNQNGG